MPMFSPLSRENVFQVPGETIHLTSGSKSDGKMCVSSVISEEVKTLP
jgi:hypothetical protein